MKSINHARRLQLKGMTAILLARQAPMILTGRSLVLGSAAVASSTATEDANAVAASSLAIVLGLISAGTAIFSAMWSTRKANESQREIAQMQRDTQILLAKMQHDFELRRAGFTRMAELGVQQERAFDPRSMNLSRAALTNDIDGHGTYVGISEGLIATQRGHYQGVMSNGEADRAAGQFNQTGVMPVPVQEGYRTPSRSETEACFEQWSKRSGRSIESLKEEVSPFCTRDYSRATRPTLAGADMRMVGVINKKKPKYGDLPTVEFLVA